MVCYDAAASRRWPQIVRDVSDEDGLVGKFQANVHEVGAGRTRRTVRRQERPFWGKGGGGRKGGEGRRD